MICCCRALKSSAALVAAAAATQDLPDAARTRVKFEGLLAAAPKGRGLRVDGLLVAPDATDVWFNIIM